MTNISHKRLGIRAEYGGPGATKMTTILFREVFHLYRIKKVAGGLRFSINLFQIKIKFP